MKQYKILTSENSTADDVVVNKYAEDGYRVCFVSQSEDDRAVHYTIVMEKEVGQCL